MKILFITHAYPNYVPDLLLHGLRKLMGPDVVDYPRKDCLYKGVLGLGVCPEDQLCPQWFPDDTNSRIDRGDVWQKALRGNFDMVVADWRAWPVVTQKLNGYSGPLAVIDGEDRPVKIKPGPYVVFRRETWGTDMSIPMPMALPEEIYNWIIQYDGLPKKYTVGFLGSTLDGVRLRIVEAIARWYPDSLFAATSMPSKNNPKPAGRESRDSYYQALQSCRFVLNLAGGGYDTFRFWENAACNSLQITQTMPLVIPDDFRDQDHLLRFGSIDELRMKIDAVVQDSDTMKSMVAASRHHLINHHLTIHRANYFIQCMANAYG
jgi:hypothetical protein